MHRFRRCADGYRFALAGAQLFEKETYKNYGGYVNEENLCYTGPCPGDGLSNVFGVRVEEYDGFSEKDRQAIIWKNNGKEYEVKHVAERFRAADTAEVMAVYANDFYAGEPAVVRNDFGKGQAWYLGARTDVDMLQEFYKPILQKAGAKRLLPDSVPAEIHASMRILDDQAWLFVFNLGEKQEQIQLPDGVWSNAESGQNVSPEDLILKPYDVKIFTGSLPA